MNVREKASNCSTKSFPNAKSMNIKCQNIVQHWGVIWSNLYSMIESTNQMILTKNKWSYRDLTFKMTHPSSHISSFNIKLFPDYYEKQLHIQYNNPTLPKLHSQSTIEKYCMNQYLKSISMKNSLSKIPAKSVKDRHEKIPTYYMYNYGTITFNNHSYEDIVFTIHIPCMCAWEREEYPIISSTFSMLIPHEMEISSNTFLWDVFLDNLNKLFFDFQLSHCEYETEDTSYHSLTESLTTCINHFDEYLLALTIPKKKKELKQIPFIPSYEFLQKVIASHIISHYTLIVSDVPSYSQYIYDLLYPLDQANLYNQPNTQPLSQKIISIPNPFFRTICLTSFTEEQYFILPYPFCVIDPVNQTVGRSLTQSISRYFVQRQNYFMTYASKKLFIPQFVPTIKVLPELLNPPSAQILSPYILLVLNLLQQNKSLVISSVLLQLLNSCSLKAHLISELLKKLSAKYNDGTITPFIVNELEHQMGCDLESLRVILGSYKFTEPHFVGMVIDGIEKSM
ncbi:hypothetical protein ENU1_049120 [Entamoeba nuttalli P19]|uniref:Uncharacterized protein n=1 Tax=Entamoeba nuttalli (strain P19) TaxID=1076696 RepID=K2H5K0_ENTNP|nr:hypothetical protein ENU1_049120 [Entamoeba nuttalli P19]EKE41637.1 hypothetical protein ENU1_049120 [Entamoeba nuttalli P19]|eukprot:XP_008856030.1 hypothetical protein ENU1_049120 [Entamoeba nuttalli P19]